MLDHHSIIEFLVADQRCPLNAINRKGKTPLHVTFECGYLDVIKVLASKENCCLNVADREGNTPLHSACKHGHHSTVELLVADQR